MICGCGVSGCSGVAPYDPAPVPTYRVVSSPTEARVPVQRDEPVVVMDGQGRPLVTGAAARHRGAAS